MRILRLEVLPNVQSLLCFPQSGEQTSCLLYLQWLSLSAAKISASWNATLAEEFICVMRGTLYLKNTLILKHVVLMIRKEVN